MRGNQVALEVKNLSKTYKIYNSPYDNFVEILRERFAIMKRPYYAISAFR